jgi:hypothetical protein
VVPAGTCWDFGAGLADDPNAGSAIFDAADDGQRRLGTDGKCI